MIGMLYFVLGLLVMIIVGTVVWYGRTHGRIAHGEPGVSDPVAAPPEDPYHSDETLNTAVLQNLDALNGYVGESEPAIQCQEQRIVQIRKWAQGLADKRVRRQYLDWLDHFERQNQKAHNDLVNHRRQAEREEYEREQKERYRYVPDVREKIPRPPPETTRCERGGYHD
jgi:hypothetical protein